MEILINDDFCMGCWNQNLKKGTKVMEKNWWDYVKEKKWINRESDPPITTFGCTQRVKCLTWPELKIASCTFVLFFNNSL